MNYSGKSSYLRGRAGSSLETERTRHSVWAANLSEAPLDIGKARGRSHGNRDLPLADPYICRQTFYEAHLSSLIHSLIFQDMAYVFLYWIYWIISFFETGSGTFWLFAEETQQVVSAYDYQRQHPNGRRREPSHSAVFDYLKSAASGSRGGT